MAQYPFKQVVAISKLILQRVISQFGRRVLMWFGGAIVVVGVLYFGMVAAVYVECFAFGRLTYSFPRFVSHTLVCSNAK